MNWRKRYKNILFTGAIIKGTKCDIEGCIMKVIGFRPNSKYPILEVLENKNSKFFHNINDDLYKHFLIGGIIDRGTEWEGDYQILR